MARTEKQVADEALEAVAVLGLFAQGEQLVRNEEHLDELFDQVIDLLELARNERWRLRTKR